MLLNKSLYDLSMDKSPADYILMDSHCHLDFIEFDGYREELWAKCRQNNIRSLLIPGVHPDQWQSSYELTKTLIGVKCSAGVHPWWIDKLNDEHVCDKGLSYSLIKKLDKALQQKNCVAIGECGLDKTIATNLELQQAIFEQHIQYACDTGLPIIMHVRKTQNETLRLLSRYRPSGGGVVHGFTGSLELAKQYWALGLYLGVGGSITYPRANKTRHALANMPIESLLLETDAPDMPLNGYQGEPNSPLKIINIAKKLAELRAEPIEYIAMQTTKNAHLLFNLT
jgi:TatD DNase family protein